MKTKKLVGLTQDEYMKLFGEVREAMEEGCKWYQRAGYVANEDVNKVIKLVEAGLPRLDVEDVEE